MTRIDYGNPVTRIRSREKNLLDQGRISRLLEAADTNEVLKVLAETEYGTQAGEGQDQEEILERELRRVHRFLREIIPDPRLRELIAIPYDLQNLRVLIKSKENGRESGDLMVDLGRVPTEELKNLVEEEAWGELPPLLGEPLSAVLPDLVLSLIHI